MAETVDSVPGEGATREAIREGLADVRRELTELVACEAQLAASAHRRELRRLAVDAGAPLAIALALLTAFGLANAAAVSALTRVMSAWAAALVLAAAWIVIGALLALATWWRGEHGKGLRWWRLLTGVRDGPGEELTEARDRAGRAVRETLTRLAPGLTQEAAAVVVPMASAVSTAMAAEVAGGVVDAGVDLIEGSDDLVEAMTEDLPGGGVVNQIWDVVLVPGRLGVRVATTVLRRPPRAG